MRKYLFIEALIKFLEIFSESNYGTAEVDIAAVVAYVESPKFALRDSWDIKSVEDCYSIIEEMALNGFPLWDFLKISDWAKKMFEKDFQAQIQKGKDELRKKFKCYQGCQFYEENNTIMGVCQRCMIIAGEKRREAFSPKKTCRNFKKKE